MNYFNLMLMCNKQYVGTHSGYDFKKSRGKEKI